MPRSSVEVQQEIHQRVFEVGVAAVNALTAIRPNIAALDKLSDELKSAREIEAAVEATKAPPPPPPPAPGQHEWDGRSCKRCGLMYAAGESEKVMGTVCKPAPKTAKRKNRR
jgi:hypothetical protein